MTNKREWILALFGSLLGYGVATAQFSAMDPVSVAPHIYEEVLVNDRVRVLKVTERNGETPPIHSHPERLAVFLSPCAWMATEANGEERMHSYRLGDVLWKARETHGGITSRVVQTCSRLEIEMRQTQ
jgi:hypothetical protein